MIASGKITAEAAGRLATTVTAVKPESSPRARQQPPQDAQPQSNSVAEAAMRPTDADDFSDASAATVRVGMLHRKQDSICMILVEIVSCWHTISASQQSAGEQSAGAGSSRRVVASARSAHAWDGGAVPCRRMHSTASGVALDLPA